MRNEFTSAILELADRDPRVMLLTGDLGYTVLEPFAEAHPDRFFNCGVAEQNMVGLATGLAEAGFIPFVYSIATFASMRAYEFIRNGAALHDLPVRVVGVGGGLDYGHNGVTHYALEDVALMRVQPRLTILAPADPAQARAALEACWQRPGPIYLRLGKESAPVPGLDGRFELGRPELIGEGSDVAILALGTAAHQGVEAARTLAAEGVGATVAVVSSLDSSPLEDLAELLGRCPLALSVEAHYQVGGLGSLAAELIAERGLDCRLIRCGVAEMPTGLTGSQGFLNEAHGLTGEALAGHARRALGVAARR